MTTHLRIVPPPEATPTPRRKRGHASVLSLTAEEARALRVSTRNIARTYGGLAGLARALGCSVGILSRKKRPGAGLAVALSRLTRIPVETLLTAQLAAVPSPAPSTQGGAS